MAQKLGGLRIEGGEHSGYVKMNAKRWYDIASGVSTENAMKLPLMGKSMQSKVLIGWQLSSLDCEDKAKGPHR
jgi:hypothetical protein